MINPFCIGAYIICASPTPRYLLLHRCSPFLKGTWQMVTGGIEEGEMAYEAAVREIKEETGITPDQFYSADAVETFYMKMNDKVAFVPVFVAFVDEIKPVQLSPHEHDAYEWLPFEEARARLVFAEQKRVITHIHENFILKTPHPVNLIDLKQLI